MASTLGTSDRHVQAILFATMLTAASAGRTENDEKEKILDNLMIIAVLCVIAGTVLLEWTRQLVFQKVRRM